MQHFNRNYPFIETHIKIRPETQPDDALFATANEILRLKEKQVKILEKYSFPGIYSQQLSSLHETSVLMRF